MWDPVLKMAKMGCLTESRAPCFYQTSCQCAPGSACLSPPRIEVTEACPRLLNGCWGSKFRSHSWSEPSCQHLISVSKNSFFCISILKPPEIKSEREKNIKNGRMISSVRMILHVWLLPATLISFSEPSVNCVLHFVPDFCYSQWERWSSVSYILAYTKCPRLF